MPGYALWMGVVSWVTSRLALLGLGAVANTVGSRDSRMGWLFAQTAVSSVLGVAGYVCLVFAAVAAVKEFGGRSGAAARGPQAYAGQAQGQPYAGQPRPPQQGQAYAQQGQRPPHPQPPHQRGPNN